MCRRSILGAISFHEQLRSIYATLFFARFPRPPGRKRASAPAPRYRSVKARFRTDAAGREGDALGRDGDDKLGSSRFGAVGGVLSAIARSAMRRARPGAPSPRTSAEAARDPGRPLDLAEERAASRDLLAIDAVIRRYYALGSAGDWERFRALFHAGATVGTGGPDPATGSGRDDVPVERFIDSARTWRSSRFGERSRTVHVLGDLAVVISAFEVVHGDAPAPGRGVNVFQLRIAPQGGWLIQSVLTRSVERAITEKSADPRPLASRRG